MSKRCLHCESDYINKFHPSQRANVSQVLSKLAKDGKPYKCQGKLKHSNPQDW